MNQKNNILKFILRTFGFGIFASVMYLVFLIISGTLLPVSITKNLQFNIGSNGHFFSKVQEVDRIQNVDIVFVGSSHSYRGYDPRIFKQHNLNVFNLGSSAQPPKVSKLLLERYVPVLKPKLVVIDIFPSVFQLDGVEAELDYISNSQPNRANLEMALRSKNIKVINTYLYSVYYNSLGFYSKVKEGKVKQLNRNNPEIFDTYISGGYVQTSRKNFNYLNFKVEDEFIVPNEENWQAFEDMLNFLKENNIHYILVQTPITEKLYHSYINNKELNKTFSTYGTYYDFNETLHLSDTLFYDSNHMNQKGVEIYNEAFINVLKKDPTFISSMK